MAGTDDQPDDEGPAPNPNPDPDSDPDDGPTPDDADPPPPDDDGAPPDDARPDRRGGQRNWDIRVAAAAFVVGTLFSLVQTWLSYRSAVESKDAVVVSREALNDSRRTQVEDALKELARVSFSTRLNGDQFILELRNGSPRPFVFNNLTYFLRAPDESNILIYTAGIGGITSTGLVAPCTRAVLTVDARKAGEFSLIEQERKYLSKWVDGIDFVTREEFMVAEYGVLPMYAVRNEIPPSQTKDRMVYFNQVENSPIEGC